MVVLLSCGEEQTFCEARVRLSVAARASSLEQHEPEQPALGWTCADPNATPTGSIPYYSIAVACMAYLVGSDSVAFKPATICRQLSTKTYTNNP